MAKTLDEMNSTELKAEAMAQIENLEAILRGETVNGVKLGSIGVNREWATYALAELRELVKQHDEQERS